MGKNLGIIFYFSGDNVIGMQRFGDLNKELKEFFMWCASKCDGDMFDASHNMQRAMDTFEISRATYYNRINKLVKSHLMKKRRPSIYVVNKAYAHIIPKQEKEMLEAIKEFNNGRLPKGILDTNR